jgi:predicted AAA+ superfamily ATPase
VLGPRQVGKSTLIRGLQPDLTINLARQSEYHLFMGEPARLEEVVEAKLPKTVFIDEVQRIPSLLNSVQALIDEHEGKIKFYLSGSSARKLRRGNANLLPGRLFVFRLGGLCGAEIPLKTPTDKLLRFGALPEIVLNSDDGFCASLLDAYAGTYLREEIQAEAMVENLQGFSRFLTEASLAAGQVLDYSKIAKRAKISRTTCVRFFEILVDTLMVDKCNSFTELPDTVKHPKFFFFDNGVRNALTGSYDLSPERRGLVFEHFIFNQIKNSALARNKKIEIFYFRTRSGLEVDFIIKVEGIVWAVEVKSGSITDDDLKPLRAFRKLCPHPIHPLAVGLKEKTPRKTKDAFVCDWRTMLDRMGL